MCNFVGMKQTLEDYIRHDEEFRQALLKLGGGILKYWTEHPEYDFDIDLFNGYEKQVVEAYLQANKRNRALRSLPDDKLKWDALSWYHHESGKELKFYTDLRPELNKLPKEVKEQADRYFVDYLEDNYREYLRYAYPTDITPIDFYDKVIRAFGVGGLARDCMDYILKDHHHPEVWSKMKSVDVVMTEFYIEEYSAFVSEERCFKKLRQGVKEKLAGKNQYECRREAVKMMNLVRGFARMLYSSSEIGITDCTGEYKVDKKWLRGQTEGLAAAFRRDGYLKNSFSEYVGILNDIGRIWAAQLLLHGIDMHELEKETGAILYLVSKPTQDPDGLNHDNYKYYVDKDFNDPLDDQCCIYDEKQAKELLDSLRSKQASKKEQHSPNIETPVTKTSGQGMKKSGIRRSLEKIHWALGGVKDMIDRPTDILPEHLQMLGTETKAALQFVISLCDYMIDDGELDISEDLVIIHDEAVKISNGEYGRVPGDALTEERQPIIDEIFINVDNMWVEIQHYWEWEENEQRQKAITPPPPSHDEDYYGKDEDIFHENLDPGKIATKILLLDRKKANGDTIADRNFILILYNVFSSHPGCMTKKQKKKLLNWVKFNCKIYFKTSHLKRVKLDDEEMIKIDLYHEEFANKQPSGKWFFKKEFYRIDPITKDPKKSIDGAW